MSLSKQERIDEINAQTDISESEKKSLVNTIESLEDDEFTNSERNTYIDELIDQARTVRTPGRGILSQDD